MVEAALHRRADADGRFHARDVGGEHVFATHAAFLRDAEGGGQASDRRMDDGGQMRVVEIEAVQQHTVDEHGIAQRQALGATDDGRATAATERLAAGQRASREGVGVGRQRAADGVEHQVFGALANGGRDICQLHVVHEPGEPARGESEPSRTAD